MRALHLWPRMAASFSPLAQRRMAGQAVFDPRLAGELQQLKSLRVVAVVNPDRATELLTSDPWDDDFLGGHEGNEKKVAEVEQAFCDQAAKGVWKDDEKVAHTLHLAGVYIKNYKLDKADGVLQSVEQYCEKCPGPFLWKHLQKVATLRFKQNRQAECAECFETLLRIAPDNPATRANLTTAYNSLGQYDKALEHIEAGVALKGGEEDKDDKWSLGLVYKNLGDTARAVAYLGDALTLFESSPADPVMVAKVHDSYADALKKNGDLEGAERHYRLAYRMFIDSVGNESPLTGSAASLLGGVLTARGMHAEARTCLLHALRVESTKDGVHPTPLYELLSQLINLHTRSDAGSLDAQGLEDARPHIHAAVANLEARGALDDGNAGVLLHKMGEALLFSSTAHAGEAVQLLERARRLLKTEATYDVSSLLEIIDLELEAAQYHLAPAAEPVPGRPAPEPPLEAPEPQAAEQSQAPSASEAADESSTKQRMARLEAENQALRSENSRLREALRTVKLAVADV